MGATARRHVVVSTPDPSRSPPRRIIPWIRRRWDLAVAPMERSYKQRSIGGRAVEPAGV